MKKYLPEMMSFLSKLSPKLAARVALNIFATPVRTPRPASEKIWHETAKKYFLKTGIAAFEWGDPKDPLVLLIHGWNGRGTQLASFAESLVKNKFRVVALDGPGHGISPGKKTNPAHYAQFIIDSQIELIGAGASSHAVIAHSFGGGCSVLALKRGLKTNGLVLIASPAFYDRVVHFFSLSIKLSDEAEKYFTEMITKLTGIPPRELNIGKIGSLLNKPVLVVHDENDNAVNYLSAKAIVEEWPKAQLFTTQGLGHRRIMKDPQVIEVVTKFITALRT